MKQIAKKDSGLLVVADGKFIFCDSRMVAEKFGVKHARVIRTIERNKGKYDESQGTHRVPSIGSFSPVFIKTKETYQGQEFDSYQMNKDAFMVIAVRFETPKAIEWQKKFFSAFKKMEAAITQIATQKANAEWLEQRASGKLIRHLETDTLKKFVEYATSQGSRNAHHYYSNISTMQNKALFFLDQKYKNVRDLLDIHQLATLQIADRIVIRALEAGMNDGLHYKEIYQIAKKNIETFAMIHGKSAVPVHQIVNSGQKQLAIA